MGDTGESLCYMVGVTMELASLVSAFTENGSVGVASSLELGDESVFCGEAESEMGDERGGEILRAVVPSRCRGSRAPVSNGTLCER